MIGLTDTHCHLDFEVFNDDRDQVIERALDAGVQFMVNPGIDINTSHQALYLANQYPQLFAAVGVHPNETDLWNDTSEKEIRQYIQNDKVIAIGEIGLDYYRDHTEQDLQRKVFHTQLECAAELSLPVIIHSRDAMNDTLEILENWQNSLTNYNKTLANNPGVLHAFEGNLNDANRAVKMNFQIGVGGPITFKNASMRREMIRSVPLNHIVVETDSPFLTPDPYRGRRNEPAYTQFIAAELASLFNEPLETVIEATTKNAVRVFGWSL